MGPPWVTINIVKSLGSVGSSGFFEDVDVEEEEGPSALYWLSSPIELLMLA